MNADQGDGFVGGGWKEAKKLDMAHWPVEPCVGRWCKLITR